MFPLLIVSSTSLITTERAQENKRQAQILYPIGRVYSASADQFKAYKDFFRQLAVEHFRQATIKDASWPLPYLYLANLYSQKMRALKPRDEAGKS